MTVSHLPACPNSLPSSQKTIEHCILLLTGGQAWDGGGGEGGDRTAVVMGHSRAHTHTGGADLTD
ncbi:hypothetical protein WMY93_024476 [Mugilogobius chulae]|uniref:Uncharacterized protein n=1 Tax=Mugilogobius chulae TaxID=88201 RepID=A0AAW0N6I7_9GOBI